MSLDTERAGAVQLAPEGRRVATCRTCRLPKSEGPVHMRCSCNRMIALSAEEHKRHHRPGLTGVAVSRVEEERLREGGDVAIGTLEAILARAGLEVRFPPPAEEIVEPLTHEERRVIEWIATRPSARYGECSGISLTSLIERGLVDLDGADMGDDAAVSLSPAGKAIAARIKANFWLRGDFKLARVPASVVEALGVTGWTSRNTVEFVVEPGQSAAAGLASILSHFVGRIIPVDSVADAMRAAPRPEKDRP